MSKAVTVFLEAQFVASAQDSVIYCQDQFGVNIGFIESHLYLNRERNILREYIFALVDRRCKDEEIGGMDSGFTVLKLHNQITSKLMR